MYPYTVTKDRGRRVTWELGSAGECKPFACPKGLYTIAVTGVFRSDCAIELHAEFGHDATLSIDSHGLPIVFTAPGVVTSNVICDKLKPVVKGDASGVRLHLVSEDL